MFDIGFQELTLLGVIALIVVGPERLPKMVRTLGLWAGKVRYYVNQVKNDIEQEVRAQEIKELLDKPTDKLEDLYTIAEETKGTLDEAKAAIETTSANLPTANEPAAVSLSPIEEPSTSTIGSVNPATAETHEPNPSTATSDGSENDERSSGTH